MRNLHGPFSDKQLGGGPQRQERKDELMIAARSKQCGCDLCNEKGQQGLPTDNLMWYRGYICIRPIIV